MSHIHLQDLPALMKQCKEAIKSAVKNDMNDTFVLLTDLHEILHKSLEERRDGAVPPPPKALNLENRLDLAAQYIRDLRVTSAPDVRAIQSPPHLGWVATLVTDRIGNAAQTITRWAESPADALSLALADAAEWVKKQKDIR